MVDVRLDLCGNDDQARLLEILPEGAVLVLDGLTLLTRPGREAWAGFAGWLRMLRRAGHAVVLVEPTARTALAALADTLVTVGRGQGGGDLALAVRIASRQPLAAADRTFQAVLELAEGRARWRRAMLVPPELHAVIAAARQGGTVREIAARAGLATGTAWRRLDKGAGADRRRGCNRWNKWNKWNSAGRRAARCRTAVARPRRNRWNAPRRPGGSLDRSAETHIGPPQGAGQRPASRTRHPRRFRRR
jgi:hypothetical protein